MTKYLTTTSINLISGGDAITFEDTEAYTGGSAAASMLKQGQDIRVKAADGKDTIIPWHAVALAEITHSTSTVEDPVDDFCTEPDAVSDGGNDGNGDGGNDGNGG